jgi:hypothetical protein
MILEIMATKNEKRIKPERSAGHDPDRLFEKHYEDQKKSRGASHSALFC